MSSDRNHHLADDLLHEYLDGELNAKASAPVQQHLDGCGDCSARLQVWRELFRDIEELPDLEQGIDFEPIVLARLSQPRAGRGWTLWLQIGQAALALGLTVFGWARFSSDLPSQAISRWLKLPIQTFNHMLTIFMSGLGESIDQILSGSPSGSDLIASIPQIPFGGTLLAYLSGLLILLWIACNHYLLRVNGHSKDAH